jgi:hypothetical protein
MVWIVLKAVWFVLPTFDAVFIGRKSVEGFKPFGEVVGLQEVVEMLLQLRVSFVVIALDSSFLQRPVHAFNLAVWPRMARLGETRLDAMLLTGILEGMHKG